MDDQSAQVNRVSAAIEEMFAEELPRDPDLEGYEFFILFSQGEMIQDSIDNLETAALWGGSLAFLVLVVGLGGMAATIDFSSAVVAGGKLVVSGNVNSKKLFYRPT